MLTDPLPHYVDIRKLAAKGMQFDAQLPLVELTRLCDALVDNEGIVEVKLSFGVDDQRNKTITGQAACDVKVVCQRCLQAMVLELKTEVMLGLVWEEAQASSLPKEYDSLVVGEDPVDLYEIVEDELLLKLPFVSYHDPEHCAGSQSYSSSSDEVDKTIKEQAAKLEKENPFNILESLKSKK